MILNSIEEQMSKRQEIKPRHVKKKALAQIFSQRVIKANRLVITEIKPRSKTLYNDDGWIRD